MAGKLVQNVNCWYSIPLYKYSFFVIFRQSEMLPANNHLFLRVERKTLIGKSKYAENL